MLCSDCVGDASPLGTPGRVLQPGAATVIEIALEVVALRALSVAIAVSV
jgi:hypothetical protein